MKKILLYVFIVILFAMNIFIIIQNINLKHQIQASRLMLESQFNSRINAVQGSISSSIRNILRENQENWIKSSEFLFLGNKNEEVSLEGHFVLSGLSEEVSPLIIYWPRGKIDRKINKKLTVEGNGQYTVDVNLSSSNDYYYQISYYQNQQNIVSEPRILSANKYYYQDYSLNYDSHFDKKEDSNFKIFEIIFNGKNGNKINDGLLIKKADIKYENNGDEKTINLYPIEKLDNNHLNENGPVQVTQLSNFTTYAYIRVPLRENEEKNILYTESRDIYINNEDLNSASFYLIVEYNDGYIKKEKIITSDPFWKNFLMMKK